MTYMSSLAAKGDAEGVLRCIEQGADPNEMNLEALCQASKNGHIDVVKVLIKAGAKPYLCNSIALCEACENGHAAIVRVLCRGGAYFSSSAAANLAAKSGYYPVLKALIDAGADPDYMVRLCCFYGQMKALTRLLKLKCIDRVELNNALRSACKGGHLAAVKKLEKVISLKVVNAFYDACGHGHNNIVRYFLKGAFKDRSNLDLSSAIEYSLERGYTKTAMILLNAGIKISQSCWREFTGRFDEPRSLSPRKVKQVIITSTVRNEMMKT